MDTTQVRETQIEAIISKACGKYRAGDSYTFEDVWKCVEVALASAPAEAGPVPKWREVPSDEPPAATRLRERFEAEHGDMAGVMQAVNAYGYVVDQFRRPYNHESTEPVSEADLKAAKQTMFDRIRAEALWLCANATVRATAQQPVGFRTRVPGFAWVPWLTDDQETIQRTIQEAAEHGHDGEALFAGRLTPAAASQAKQDRGRVDRAVVLLSTSVEALGKAWASDDGLIKLGSEFLRVELAPGSQELQIWRDFVLCAHEHLVLTEIDERAAMQLAIDAGGKVIPSYGTRGDMVAMYGDQLTKVISRRADAAMLGDRTRETGESSDRKAAERKLTCEAIDGAMAFGYLNLNEPPAAHWLAPWWTAGQSQRAAMNALRYLDRELTQYLGGMPADETSRKLRDAARDGLAGVDSSPLAATAAATLLRELEALIASAAQHPLTAAEVSKAREIARACGMLRGGPADGDPQTTTAENIKVDTSKTGAA